MLYAPAKELKYTQLNICYCKENMEKSLCSWTSILQISKTMSAQYVKDFPGINTQFNNCIGFSDIYIFWLCLHNYNMHFSKLNASPWT